MGGGDAGVLLTVYTGNCTTRQVDAGACFTAVHAGFWGML